MRRRLALSLGLGVWLAVALVLPASAAAASGFRPVIGKAMGLVPSFGHTNLPDPAVGIPIPAVYHGGSTMTTGQATVHTIFWAPAGYQFSGSPSPGVLGYEDLVKQFLTDVAHDSGSQSNVFSVLSQYGSNSGGGSYNIAYSSATDSIDDTNPYPSQASQCASPAGVPTCVTDAEISAEVDRVIAATDPSGRGQHDIWEVFLPPGVDECIDPGVCGTNAYAGYHSLADQGHGTFLYAVIIDPMIEVPAHQGADPQGNPDAELTIDTTSHETMESLTDPEGVGWMDPSGYEVGDKCENPEYGTPLGYAPNGSPYNQVINGHQYLIQEEWSNAAGGCVQQSATTSDGLPLPTISLTQFSSRVTGNIAQSRAGVAVRVSLLRAGTLVARGETNTNAAGDWAVTLRGARGLLHAVGDDRDQIEVDYGPGGPTPDLIETGSGGDPYAEAGWTGWLDLDTGVSAGQSSLTYGPCFQTGVATVQVNGAAIASPTPECYTPLDTATVPAPNLGGRNLVTFTTQDNRAPSALTPLGALVGLTVPVGEPGSVSAIGNSNVPFSPTGLPTCTAELRIQRTRCGGLVPGSRYRLSSSRGGAARLSTANGQGFATFSGFRIRGGDVLTLTNAPGRVLTRLHVAHLRVDIKGDQTVVSGGTCQPGDYWGPPLTSIPSRPVFGVGGAAGLGRICGNRGRASGMPATTIEQVDDLSGGATMTSVPLLTGTAPVNDAIVYGGFRVLAQAGVPGPHGGTVATPARVSVIITRGRRRVFAARNVTGGGVAVARLPAGVYRARWVVSNANGDTRTVLTRFVEQ